MRRLALIAFLVVVYGPMIALAAGGVSQLVSAETGSVLKVAVPTGRQWVLLARTVLFAACVSAGVATLGILVGSVLWRWSHGVGAWARWLVLVLIAVPPYVHALAWTSTAGAASSALSRIGLTLPALAGWPGAWWVEVMAYAPLAVGLMLLGLASVDPTLLEAARVSRPDMHGFATIALPLAAPQILAGCGLVFIFSLTDYGVPSLFQLSVYPLELFVRYSGGDPVLGTLLVALPLLAIAVAVMAWSQSGLREAVMKPLWGARPPGAPFRWPAWFTILQKMAIVLMLAQILVPIASLCMAVRSWANLTGALVAARGELLTSLWIVLLAGGVCLPMALAVAGKLVRPNAPYRRWWLLVLLPLAIPAPLTGIGLIAMWNRPVLEQFYGTLAMPILAALARFTPLAVLVVVAQLRRIDPLLFDAGRVFQKGRIWTWIQILLPMLAPGLLASGCVVGALSAGELGATLIVAPPGRATLTMRIYSYLHYGASENVAGLCLMMAVGTLACALLAAIGFRAWSRLFPSAVEARG